MNRLITLARAAGLSGQSWGNWTCSDEVRDIVDTGIDFDTDVLDKAFEEGARERRITVDGWVKRWTTAPEGYDSFGTETLETIKATATMNSWRGDTIRCVLIDPRHLEYHACRYSSGLHPCWEVDPRIQEAEMVARLDKDRAEREAEKAKREAGLAWLLTASAAEIDDSDENYSSTHARGLSFKDLRAERDRRRTELERDKLADEWNRCNALVPMGVTLIDDGSEGERGLYGRVGVRKPHVWYNVFIHGGFASDAETAHVVGEGLDNCGSLAYVADWLTSGRLRVAKPGEVPPRAVLERIGQEQIKTIRRAEIDGKVCYIGRPLFGETIVLDANGHLVRSKTVKAEALRMFPPSY